MVNARIKSQLRRYMKMNGLLFKMRTSWKLER
ncbi:Two-component response regulator [Bacillus thuringiensis serovar israelensis ATCC 35646]|nr:Two-component response regulator [Bacillus thuringiensis serovar israelensis ATCC 35646]